MQIRLIKHNSNEYWQSVALRDRVLREPLGLKFDQEDLMDEFDDIHICGFYGKELIATLMLCKQNKYTVQMRQVAVDEKYQGKELGKQLVAYSEKYCIDRGYRKIIVHAREAATSFYVKMGYTIEGEKFEQVEIPHYRVIKVLK